jgi:hypothetical protein
MPMIFIPLLIQLPFRSVSMETNMKIDNDFKQQMPDITGRYRSNSYTCTNFGDIVKHYISSTFDTWRLQTDRKAANVGPR